MCESEKGVFGRENQEKESGRQRSRVAGRTEEEKFLSIWSNGSVLDLAREVKKIWAQNQLLTVQMQQTKQQLREKGEEERKIKEKVREWEVQSKELKNQVVSFQESGVETLKEVKARGRVRGDVEK